MGCGTSVATESQAKQSEKELTYKFFYSITQRADESLKASSPALAMKAAVLIQRWYRRYMARIEIRRRYTWSIFQSIEYAGEQDQLQLSSFFTFMLDNFTHLGGASPDLISQFLDPTSDPMKEEGRAAKYEKIEVPDSYPGPRLSFPLTVAHTNALLRAFKQQQQHLHARYVLQLLHETKKFLKKLPNIIHLSTSYTKEITICGDLHGKLDDLLLIFYKNGLPSTENPYVFNGDFVDRGKSSVEILIILFAFLLLYPNDMHLNRGNHEDHIMNLRYGFTKEVMQKYRSHGREILLLLQDVFSLLPLATIIDNKVLIVHGGVSDMTDLDYLASIERHKFKSALRPPRMSIDSCQDKGRRKTKGQLPTQSSGGHRSISTRYSSNHLMKPSSGASSPSSSSSSLSSSIPESRRMSDVQEKDTSTTSNGQHPLHHRSISPAGILEVPFLDSDVTITPKVPSWEEMEWKQIVDLLWSDPKNQNGCSPNSFRGGGCYFGPDVTLTLLKKYRLKMLIRSHECKQEGYELCHDGQVITIFSASNYYEEGSNRGAYIKLGPDLVPRFFQYQVSKFTRRMTLQQRVSVAEGSALKSLREKLYAHRSELIAAFKQYDTYNTGTVSTSDWASAVESVLRLDLPEDAMPRLVRLAPNGSVEYLSCFEDLHMEQPIKEVTPSLVETLYRYRTDLEIIFNMIDKDHSGLISIEEFHQTWRLFSSHLHIHVDNAAIDDLARSIDFNKDGSIDFNEFLEAFRVVHKLDSKEKH
ncbi:serine/threonine-protein phosphatase with EF-hands 1-like isoform X2 [Acipenser oxyrinchus oxyrinchus]|uniref:Serine/threonine-protein phosphatase with EF-hands n=1 Tax=Acipenser oxyrinchus oxyrinchus TaxID=40147 RepID=A0AAD8DEE4_ACIOX|nr:serine/threonine-protein phosphatase with EF-hands 1-like isoform X2 [Acipenser oxyrinchus oxyrinchus]